MTRKYIFNSMSRSLCMGGSRGRDRGSGPPPPPGKSQKYSVSYINTGPDPLNNLKVTKPAFIFGPFKWRFAVEPMMARFLCYLDLLFKKKVGAPLAKLFGSAHDCEVAKHLYGFENGLN